MCEDCERTRQDNLLAEARSELAKERIKGEALRKSLVDQEKTIADLRNTLTLAVRGLQGNNIQVAHVPYNGKCLFRTMLPIEIRLKIYKLLLFNPQLSETHWLDQKTQFGATFKYELSPSILRTCHWVNAEASPVLYGSNKFAMLLTRKGKGYESTLPQCALTRYLDDQLHRINSPRDGPFTFDKILSFQMVKKWKVFTWNSTTKPLAQFVRALCQVSSVHLDIIVVLSDTLPTNQPDQSEKKRTAANKEQMNSVAQVLDVLRNVKSMEVRAGQQTDLPGCLKAHITPYFPEKNAYRTIEAKCERVAMSNRPVEKVFEMQSRLLAYVLSFERDPERKIQLTPGYPHPQKDTDVLNMNFKADPFGLTQMYENSLEARFQRSEEASVNQDHKRFREIRNHILTGLEPQYNRIVKASIELRRFYEASSSMEGNDIDMLEADDGDFMRIAFEEALMAVEKAAKEFEKEITPEVSVLMRKYPQRFSLTNDDLPREKAIRKMRMIQESSEEAFEHYDDFAGCFKIAFDDMIAQLVEIRKARRELLNADVLTGVKCSINPNGDDDVNEEPVDWTLRGGNIFSSGDYWGSD